MRAPKEGLLIRAHFPRKEILWPKPIRHKMDTDEVVVYTANLLALHLQPDEKRHFANELDRLLHRENHEDALE